MRRWPFTSTNVCPACNGCGTLRVQGTGEPFRQIRQGCGLFCTRALGHETASNCGFVVSSGPCTLARQRFVLLGASSVKGLHWGATLCSGVHEPPETAHIRYGGIVTARVDQLNASRVHLPGCPFDKISPGSTETPTAVQGFRNAWPLVMTCTNDQRWRRKTALVTLAPWDWERLIWDSSLRRRDAQGPTVRVDGYVLPLDLTSNLDEQLDCLAEVGRLLHLLDRKGRVTATAAPVAIAVAAPSADGTIDAVPPRIRSFVETQVAAVLSGPVEWFVQPEFRVRTLGWSSPELRQAIDIAAPLNGLMRRARRVSDRQGEASFRISVAGKLRLTCIQTGPPQAFTP